MTNDPEIVPGNTLSTHLHYVNNIQGLGEKKASVAELEAANKLYDVKNIQGRETKSTCGGTGGHTKLALCQEHPGVFVFVCCICFCLMGWQNWRPRKASILKQIQERLGGETKSARGRTGGHRKLGNMKYLENSARFHSGKLSDFELAKPPDS